jgi:hypothetical protein
VVLCIPTQIRREVAEKWVGTATAFERYRAYEGAARLENPADLAQRVFDRSEVIENVARYDRTRKAATAPRSSAMCSSTLTV